MFLSPINFNKVSFKTPLQISFRGSAQISSSSNVPNNDEFIKSPPKLKRGQIMGTQGKAFSRHNTGMFRQDLDWENFSQYLNYKFKDFDKVNTYVYACSSGEEAYTLSIALQHILKEGARKFFPINAKDIDENLIQKNIKNQKNERRLGASYYLTKLALNLDDKQTEEYITLEPKHIIENLTEKTTNPVKFSYANILDDIESIDSNNPSIVMCRNMWPYVDPREYKEFASKLYDKLAKGSVVVIGSYDYTGEKGKPDSKTFPSNLIRAGFEAVGKRKNSFTKGGALIFEKN